MWRIPLERLPGRLGRPPVDEPPEPERAKQSEDGRAQKVGAGADSPEPGPDERTGGDHAITDQIVSPVCPGPQGRGSFANNQRLTSRLAKFLESTHGERERQPGKTRGEH